MVAVVVIAKIIVTLVIRLRMQIAIEYAKVVEKVEQHTVGKLCALKSCTMLCMFIYGAGCY